MVQQVEIEENLARSYELIQGRIKGRGIAKLSVSAKKCICQRPYSNIMCLNCGHLMFGRIRYRCSKHPMITFLIDITNCPKCKCHEYMLSEFDVKNEDDEDEDL